QRTSLDHTSGPARSRAVSQPLVHEVRHQRRGHYRVATALRRGAEILVKEVSPLGNYDFGVGADLCDRAIGSVIHDDDFIKGDGTRGTGTIQLPDIIRAIAATADNYNCAVVAIVRCGHGAHRRRGAYLPSRNRP